ncbi:MAG: hypothetical protein AMJ54_12460 [Deltaproteobacteria bacterium SG8_13]|nr:MAG: hypothetical protein AMJ54_12460 [Deltaproteobacteria bacterium SG8_13]
MNTIGSTYRRGFRLTLHLLLTVLIGIGAMVPQALAYLGCNHACCLKPADLHKQHETVHISGTIQPSCCGQESSESACGLCGFEDQPSTDLALHSTTCGDPSTANSVATAKRSPLPDTAPRILAGWKTAAASLHSGSLYLRTLTLLI